MSEPIEIGVTLERFLAQMGAPPARTLTSLHERWPEIVGPGLAGPTRPIELVDGVLVIACDDSSWASQIGWMDGQIKSRFAAIFDDVTVQRISVRVDA